MRPVLAGSAALVGAGVMAGAADCARADGIKLRVGGEYNAAYLAVFDDDGEGEAGNEHNTDGFFQDAEIRFTGSTVLDNGLEVGARIELTGEADEDQIDESWIYFSGGFGEVRIGAMDDALALLCVIPPGGTENFSAFSPNQWGANTLATNDICTGVDDEGDAQKIIYLSPNFSGFQLGVSYTPSGDKKSHSDGVGPHVGMPVNVDDASRHNVSLYGTYSYETEDWRLQIGAGGSWEGNVEKADGEPNREESDFYQAGILVAFGDVEVGAAIAYYHDDDLFAATLENGDVTSNRWVLGIGAAYEVEAWTFGIGYSMQDATIDIRNEPDESLVQQRGVLTAIYALSPGIDLDGEIAYTWSEADPDDAPDFGGAAGYDALEVGIGIAVGF
jgi:outer membrane protein OmpU